MARATRPVRVAFGGLIALAAALGIGRFVYTPILPFMAAGLGLGKADAGLIAAANFLGYLVGALAAAGPALPGGRRRWLLGGLAASAATTGAMGLADTFEAFVILRLLGGIASAFVLVCASALVMDRLAAAGSRGLSALHFAGVGVGIAVSAVLVVAVEAAAGDWRQQWLWSGAVSLAALAGAAALIPGETEADHAPLTSGPVDRRLIALTVAYGLFGFGYVVTATFISTMVRDSVALQSIEPVVWLTVGLAGAPSVVLWTWAGRRLGDHVAFALACVVEAAGVALTAFATAPWQVLIAAALLGGTFMGITALGLIHARALTTGDPRRSVALMTAAFGLGQMIGPGFAGYAHGIGNSFVLPSLCAATALAASAVLALVPARARA